MHHLRGMVKRRTRCLGLAALALLGIYGGFQIAYWPAHINVCPEETDLSTLQHTSYLSENQSWKNLTLVTMYLNIGSAYKSVFYLFQTSHYTTDNYRTWLHAWGKTKNRVVAFFDDDEFIREFRALRSHWPESYTTIIKVNRDTLPAFQHKARVEEILQQPSFTPTYPANYTCTMYAKYDALEMALQGGHVKTKYMAWMDIGIFRGLERTAPEFALAPPPNFNSSAVGVSEVTPHSKLANLSPQEIYRQNIVWVAGGFLLATQTVMTNLIWSYRSAATKLLSLGLADTDQQVLASMYSPHMVDYKPTAHLSPFACPRGAFGLFGHGYLYFCLPYTCKASSECKVVANSPSPAAAHVATNADHQVVGEKDQVLKFSVEKDNWR